MVTNLISEREAEDFIARFWNHKLNRRDAMNAEVVRADFSLRSSRLCGYQFKTKFESKVISGLQPNGSFCQARLEKMTALAIAPRELLQGLLRFANSRNGFLSATFEGGERARAICVIDGAYDIHAFSSARCKSAGERVASSHRIDGFDREGGHLAESRMRDIDRRLGAASNDQLADASTHQLFSPRR